MKLLYVFPLMVAAVIAGGTAVHFRAAMEEEFHQYSERDLHPNLRKEAQSRRSFDRSYSDIATALNDLCNDWPKIDPQLGEQKIFNYTTDQIQKEWIDEARRFSQSKEVQRHGPRLLVSTDAGKRTFIDTGYLCFTNRPEKFRYQRKLTKSGFHFVLRIGWEWQDAMLISSVSGKALVTFEQIVESPTGKRIAAFRSLGMDGNGLQILRNDAGELVSEHHSDTNLSGSDDPP